MEVDSLSSSHPVSTPVENPTQIQEMFDDVSYDKVSIFVTFVWCRSFFTPELCRYMRTTARPLRNVNSNCQNMKKEELSYFLESI